MKGITLCADCAYHNMKKHKCTLGAKDEGDATARFYADCPLDDVAKVVFCKDCKYYKYRWETDDGKGHGICDHSTEHLLDDSFCSYGERKTDG